MGKNDNLEAVVSDLAATVRDLKEAVQRQAPVQVKSEPLTYRKDVAHSYFRDLVVRAQDPAAEARLSRHQAEMRVVAAEQERRAARALAAGDIETRTNPNRTPGQGGYFAVPLWLNDMFATYPRPGRVLARLAPGFDLPSGVSSINLPRLTAGAGTNTGADLGPVPGGDFADAATTSAVVTIDGESDVSLQMLEQSPVGAHTDWAVFQDLAADYDSKVEYQMLYGAGIGSTADTQLVGITTLSGKNPITYTSATPTNYGLYTFLGQAAAQIGNNRKLPPEAWLMTTSRWAWIGSGLDNQNRPIVTPDVHPPTVDGDGAVSTDLGWPVYCDDAIPTTIAGNQDQIIACRPSDLMLLEGTPTTSVFLEVLSGTLGARIQMRNYVAAINGRWPSGVSVVGGTGLAIQSGF